jgi:hypothetical protein
MTLLRAYDSRPKHYEAAATRNAAAQRAAPKRFAHMQLMPRYHALTMTDHNQVRSTRRRHALSLLISCNVRVEQGAKNRFENGIIFIAAATLGETCYSARPYAVHQDCYRMPDMSLCSTPCGSAVQSNGSSMKRKRSSADECSSPVSSVEMLQSPMSNKVPLSPTRHRNTCNTSSPVRHAGPSRLESPQCLMSPTTQRSCTTGLRGSTPFTSLALTARLFHAALLEMARSSSSTSAKVGNDWRVSRRERVCEDPLPSRWEVPGACHPALMEVSALPSCFAPLTLTDQNRTAASRLLLRATDACARVHA